MDQIIFAVILGIGIGGLYAMLATGLVTAFKGSGVINFAHGAFAMYTVYVYDELTKSGTLVMPWVDIIPGEQPEHPRPHPHLRRHGQPAGHDARPSSWPACSASSPTSWSSGPCATPPPSARSSVPSGSCSTCRPSASLNFGAEARQNPGFLPSTSGDNAFFTNFLGLGNLPHLIVWMAGCAIVMGAAVWALLTLHPLRPRHPGRRREREGGQPPRLLAAAPRRPQLGALGPAGRHHRPRRHRPRLAAGRPASRST